MDKYKPPTKAYKNLNFLSSHEARTIRLLAEYLEPQKRLRKYKIRDTVVFYGSARVASMEQAEAELVNLKQKLSESTVATPELKAELAFAEMRLKQSHYYEDARELARRLTEWSSGLEVSQRFIVCSGGGPGIMEAANRGASEAGGPSIGMNISIPTEQFPNPYISEELNFEFHYFFMRKYWFLYLAKALVVFPGGFGTFDELFEVLTLRQTRKVEKPVAVVAYGREYWEDVIHFDKMLEWGTIDEKDMQLFQLVDNVDEAFDILTGELKKRFMDQRRYWYL